MNENGTSLSQALFLSCHLSASAAQSPSFFGFGFIASPFAYAHCASAYHAVTPNRTDAAIADKARTKTTLCISDKPGSSFVVRARKNTAKLPVESDVRD